MPAPRLWTRDAIVAAVKAFLAKEGRAPTRLEFAPQYGLPSLRVVERRMGTWQEPLRLAQEELSDA